MSVREKLKKEIDVLPEDILQDIYDFVKFLEFRRERDIFRKVSEKLSEESFKKIWNNEEDAIYDSL
ncbi:MAG: toxin-antitoxin system, antitoxin component, Xre family protein [Caldisericia bacterium]|nr:toxin-antitoxin system, antitoxin component, Xre family protein [Caldisericia bacterium]